jgi:hypothetical protein
VQILVCSYHFLLEIATFIYSIYIPNIGGVYGTGYG